MTMSTKDIKLRLPIDLHEKLGRTAQIRDVSLNRLIVSLLRGTAPDPVAELTHLAAETSRLCSRTSGMEGAYRDWSTVYTSILEQTRMLLEQINERYVQLQESWNRPLKDQEDAF